jgi:hypothetical protein
MTALLQELMQLAVQQGNCMAAKALAVLVRSKPALQQLLPHTTALLQALQPGNLHAVQAAALYLLDAWTGTEQGLTAVGQQDWLCIAEVMVQQGSWLSNSDAAAAGYDGLDDLAPHSCSSKDSSAAEIAASIFGRLVEVGSDPLETEDCVRKLLQAVVCPPAAAWPGGSSSSSSVMRTGCNSSSRGSSSNSMPEVEGTAAGNSSSSSSMHRRWSESVATTIINALTFLVYYNEVGLAAVTKHVGLLLSAMQNTQHAYIAGTAGEHAREVARGGGMNHICTPQNIDKLLAVLQQPISDQVASDAADATDAAVYGEAADAAETAAEIVVLATQTDVGLQLLAEQGRYDAMVRATQHQNDRVARLAAEVVMILT